MTALATRTQTAAREIAVQFRNLMRRGVDVGGNIVVPIGNMAVQFTEPFGQWLLNHPEFLIGVCSGAIRHQVPHMPIMPVYSDLTSTLESYEHAFALWQSACHRQILVSVFRDLATHGLGAVSVVRLTPRIMRMINDAHDAMGHVNINLPNWMTHGTGPGHAPAGFNPFQGTARSIGETPGSSSSGPDVLLHPPHGLNYVPQRPARPKTADTYLPHQNPSGPPKRPLLVPKHTTAKQTMLPGANPPDTTSKQTMLQPPPRPLLVPKHTTSKQTMLIPGVPPPAKVVPPRVVPPRVVPPRPKATGSGKRKKVETIETKKALMPYFDIMDDPYFIKV